MARDRIPCEVKGCRRAAYWIVWRNGSTPMLLCELDRRIVFEASTTLPYFWNTERLIVGMS